MTDDRGTRRRKTADDEEQLTRTYRRLLLAYPRPWRARRQAEVLDVLVDAAIADGRSRPAPWEVVDLVGHGLLRRVAVVLDPVPRRLRERVALLLPLSTQELAVIRDDLWAEQYPPGG